MAPPVAAFWASRTAVSKVSGVLVPSFSITLQVADALPQTNTLYLPTWGSASAGISSCTPKLGTDMALVGSAARTTATTASALAARVRRRRGWMSMRPPVQPRSYVSGLCDGSLVPERDRRIDAHRPARGHVGGRGRGDDQNERCGRVGEGIERAEAVQPGPQEPGTGDRAGDAECEADQRGAQRPPQDVAQDVAASCPQRKANADLAPPPLHDV